MRKISSLIAVFALGFVIASCGGSDAAAPGGGGGGGGGGGNCPANTFCMNSTTFSPVSLTVTAGTVVTWQNDSGIIHNVIWVTAAGRNAAGAGDGVGDITNWSSGSHTRVFATPGTYDFYCNIHGTPTTGMHGTLTVN